MIQIDLARLNWKQLGSYIVIIILASLLFVKCESEKTALSTIDALTKENEMYVLENKQLVTSSNVLMIEKESTALELIGKDKELKEIVSKFSKVKTIIKYKEPIKIDSVKVPYKDSVPCIFEKTGRVFNKEYSFSYKSNQNGFEIKDLNIPNDVIIVSGIKKKWFWGKETIVTDVTNSNKRIVSINLQHIEIVPNKKFYETTICKIGVGYLLALFTIK